MPITKKNNICEWIQLRAQSRRLENRKVDYMSSVTLTALSILRKSFCVFELIMDDTSV